MIRISVCMIVKNEENVLERCLASLEGLYDELVIVDTGSSDHTKEIAGRYTDLVFDYAWKDDFADARNFAFSKATCDYIYSADADEVLDETNRIRFREMKQTLLPEIDIVQMWYLNSREFATTENFSREYRPKLYKRLRSFRWEDPVHEAVRLLPLVYDSEIEILHKPENNHGKRDFHVFEKAVSGGRQLSDKLHKMYARELMMAGDRSDFIHAAAYFEQTAWNPQTNEENRQYCYVILTKYYRLLGDTANLFKWALKNICTSPCAEVCVELGEYYLESNDLMEAMTWYQNAMSETEAILCSRAREEIPYRRMADCYERLAAEDELMQEYYLEKAGEYRKQITAD